MRANKLIGDKQNQITEEGGVAIQAGQNVTEVIVDQSRHSHYHHGVALSELIPLCTQIFDLNFPRLLAQAKDTARENAEKFAVDLKESIEQKLDKVILEKFADPDVQVLINESVQSVGRLGKNAHPSILKKLITERVGQYENEDYLNILYSQAVSLVPRLTLGHIEFLAFLFLVNNLPFIGYYHSSGLSVLSEEEVTRKLELIAEKFKLLIPNFYKITTHKFIYLQSLGAVYEHATSWHHSAYQGDYMEKVRLFLDQRFINEKVNERKMSLDQFKAAIRKICPVYCDFLDYYDGFLTGVSYRLSAASMIIVLAFIEGNGFKLEEFGLEDYVQSL